MTKSLLRPWPPDSDEIASGKPGAVHGRRDAATSRDQADRASQSRVHVVQTAVRPTSTCAALLDPASLRRDLVIKELLALRYSSWPDWD